MPITLAELKERLQKVIESLDPTNQEDFARKLTDFLGYSLENYEQLDREAKEYVDRVSENFRSASQAIVDKIPDGLQKRQMQRQIGIMGGAHFPAASLIEILASPPTFSHPILTPTKTIFEKLLQNTLDVLYDATRHSHEGAANFAKIGLSYWIVDELLSAFHLAQHAFVNQSYAHIRTSYEILDLIELFDVQPDWAKLWVSENEKEIWSELKPAAVRKKLGEPKFDPMYAFFSALGSHGTFRGLQARGGGILKSDKNDRARIKLFVGGSPHVHNIVWTNSLCVHITLALLIKMSRVFASYLNAEEIKEVLLTSSKATADFFIEYFVQWAKDEGLDFKPALEFLSKAPWTLDQD
jgi:hypothetical protein